MQATGQKLINCACGTNQRHHSRSSRHIRTSAATAGHKRASVNIVPHAREWHDVDQPLIWKGDEDAALAASSPPFLLPAPWKMMLLSDGSVTRHLQLLTGQPIQVECLAMDLLQPQQSQQQDQLQQQQQEQQDQPHIQQQEPQQQQDPIQQQQLLLHPPPPQALQIPGPLVQRQVLLWSQSSPRVPLVYAASWWSSASVDTYLADKALPIWVSLAKGHLELYREIQTVSLGHSPKLEQHFGCKGPFWSRSYLFWHNGTPLTLIHEVFSNSLEAVLGHSPWDSDVAADEAGGCGASLRG